ncbi:MAG TPA: hypothetical protein ENJ09_13590 [Planctomycetes bacterium]|nr:hypothetical protein [Planctomycetota bacterium]
MIAATVFFSLLLSLQESGPASSHGIPSSESLRVPGGSAGASSRPSKRVPLAAPGTSARGKGGTSALQAGGPTAQALVDQSGSGAPLRASSIPTLGMLFPMSSDLWIDSFGGVYVGPQGQSGLTEKLAVNGGLHVEGPVTFGTGNSYYLGNQVGLLVGEGHQLRDLGVRAVAVGGSYNYVDAADAGVFCGSGNVNIGYTSVILGGTGNQVAARWSLAAGRSALAYHDGTFVWAGESSSVTSPVPYVSTAPGQFLIRAEGGVGIGTNAPLADLHVQGTDIALPAAATSLESIAVEDQDAILGLYSNTAGNFGSGIVLGEVDAVGLVDKWALVRKTGSTRDLVLTFGSGAAYNVNPTLFTFADEGDLRIGSSAGAELSLADGSIVQGAGDLSVSAAGQVRVENTLFVESTTARVGIGISAPGFKLHVNGSAGKPGGGSWSVASDARLKKNVAELDGALEKLLRLRGVTFEYIDPESINELSGTQTGMIAQEVAEVFPGWVEEGPDGYLRLSIRGFEALAVEALRDLREEKDAELERLEARLAERDARIDELARRLARLEGAASAPPIESAGD